MIGPCERCERNSFALQLVGGHLEAMKASWRPRSVLALEADELVARVAGRNSAKLAMALDRFEYGAWRASSPASSIQAACRHQGDFPFPSALEVDPEPPWSIWLLGSQAILAGLEGMAAGVVGARRADGYGTAVARDLGRSVARAGGTVISGLAFGIDAAAHKGALDVPDGRTVAVTGGGVDVVYPKAHRSLHQQIVERGSVISEMPPGSALWRWSFPARNRLIAALSSAVVVVQGERRSGSLHTAEAALSRSIQVCAVPGRIDSVISEGPNQLLADGAAVVTGADSLLQILGLETRQPTESLSDDLKRVVIAVKEGRLAHYLAATDPTVSAAALARLELVGVLEVTADGGWRLVG
mgnify:CR=1 FL=1